MYDSVEMDKSGSKLWMNDLPDGGNWKGLWPGCDESFIMFVSLWGGQYYPIWAVRSQITFQQNTWQCQEAVDSDRWTGEGEGVRDKRGWETHPQRRDWENRQLKLETRDFTGDAGEDRQRQDPDKQDTKGKRLNEQVPELETQTMKRRATRKLNYSAPSV